MRLRWCKIIIFHCLTSDMDPTGPQTTPSQGEKLVIYRKKNPIVRGGKTL
jgi:hypothetical protein